MSIKNYISGLFAEAAEKNQAKVETAAERYLDLVRRIATGEDQPPLAAVETICKAAGKSLKKLEADLQSLSDCNQEFARFSAASETLARRHEMTAERVRLEAELEAARELVKTLQSGIQQIHADIDSATKQRDRALTAMKALPYRSPEAERALFDEVTRHRDAKAAAAKASAEKAVKTLSYDEADAAIARRQAVGM